MCDCLVAKRSKKVFNEVIDGEKKKSACVRNGKKSEFLTFIILLNQIQSMLC